MQKRQIIAPSRLVMICVKTLEYICLAGLSAVLLLTVQLVTNHHSVHAAVVINEVYPKPSDEISEWIELYNSGTDTVTVDGWKLENVNGEKKYYTFPTDTVISAGGFLTLFQIHTGISLYNEGDSVLLSDASGNLIDTQSFQSILGYNTSMGRSSDGAGSWTTCTTHSFNKPNNCPEPTKTPTPTISPSPHPTGMVTSEPKKPTVAKPNVSNASTAVLSDSTSTSPPPAKKTLEDVLADVQGSTGGITSVSQGTKTNASFRTRIMSMQLSDLLMAAGGVGILLLILFAIVHGLFFRTSR